MGLKLEGRAQQVLGIWPDNVSAFNVYTRLHSQWRIAGMGSATGLDYSTLEFFLELERVPRSTWAETVTAVQVMETEAIRLMRSKANK